MLDRDRTIATPFDHEGILKTRMEGASGLPLATTLKFIGDRDANNTDAAGAGPVGRGLPCQ